MEQEIKLMQGDCLELLKDIPDGSVDMVLTDPPYGTTACKWDSVIPFDPMWERLKRIVKRGGAIVLFGSEPFSSLLRASNIDWYKYDWIWEKEQSSSGLQAKIAPMKKHENISVFYQTFSDCYDTTEMFAELKEYMQTERKKAGIGGEKTRKLLGSYMGSHYFTVDRKISKRKTQIQNRQLQHIQPTNDGRKGIQGAFCTRRRGARKSNPLCER